MAAPKLPVELLEVIAKLDKTKDIARLLSDLLTPSELKSLGERWCIVKGLASGQTHRAVQQKLGVSVTTVSRGNRQLKYGQGGFEIAFDTLVTLGKTDPRSSAKNKNGKRGS